MDLRTLKISCVFAFMCIANLGFSQIQYLQNTPPKASIRAAKIFQNELYFAASHGIVGKSSDLKTVTWKTLKGFENVEFRSIHVLSPNEILLATAGSPALILYTKNNFNTFDTVYSDTSKNAFLDCMHFINTKDGFVLGDPKNGKMTWLVTRNGGHTWTDETESADLKIEAGEAAFAASNTNITSVGNQIWVATGGLKSNVFHSKNKGKTWRKIATPIWQGKNSTGIFSIHFSTSKNGIAVGGDYEQPNKIETNALYTADAGNTWKVATKQVLGYRSGIGHLKNIWLATGTNGTDISTDAGKNWFPLSTQGFNAIIPDSQGNGVILVGDKGKIGWLNYEDVIKNHSK